MIDELRQQALEQFGFHTAVPLFRAIGDDADHLGTGTFIAVEDKCILLTARHNLDNCKPEDVAIAASPEGPGLHTLGRCVIHKPIDLPDTDIDIVAIEILEHETIDIVKAGWRLVDIATGDNANASDEIVLVGYPSATFSRAEIGIVGSPIAITTNLLKNVPPDARRPVSATLDLFLGLPSTGIDAKGATATVPSIRGMSGSAIWQYREPAESDLWSPDRALRLVGVQCAALQGRYIRGKSWAFVSKMLDVVARKRSNEG